MVSDEDRLAKFLMSVMLHKLGIPSSSAKSDSTSKSKQKKVKPFPMMEIQEFDYSDLLDQIHFTSIEE